MALNGTMELIDSVTVPSGGQAAIEFTNIPQTYDDITIVLSGRSTRTGSSADYGLISINGSTSSFTGRQLLGNGSAVASSSPSRETGSFPAADATASTFGNATIYFPNYRSSNNKSFSIDNVTENNGTTAYQVLNAGLWSNSAAITSISLTLGNGPNWAEHSTAYLYGVTRVPAGAKATGGVISETDTHWVHTFTSSGVFTPSQSLSCDYLVVAGGGGGGGGSGGVGAGGGGAGGFRTSIGGSPISVTAQNYTITVGAGGAGGAGGGGQGVSGTASVFSTVSTTGGGGGGRYDGTTALAVGLTGGSGGGGGASGGTASGGTGTAGEGNNGGAGGLNSGQPYRGGGGGGAGAVGIDGTTSGNGGIGLENTISGTATFYAGGGGAGANITPGTGGNGGGGTGGAGAGGTPIAGTAFRGGGGGASASSTIAGAAGGSGIVVIRYAK